MVEDRAQKCSRHRSLDVHGGEQGFKANRVISVSLESDSLARRCHYRFRSLAHLLIERLLVRHSAEARLTQELGIFNAASERRRPEDVSRSPAFIQFQELVAASAL